MTTMRSNRSGTVLTETEERTWEQLVAAHRATWRGELARALFDDVRPAWDAQLAG